MRALFGVFVGVCSVFIGQAPTLAQRALVDPASFPHARGVLLQITASPSALSSPLYEQRTRLFHYALRDVFARYATVRAGPNVLCAGRRAYDDSAPQCPQLLTVEDELTTLQQAREATDPAGTTVLLHAGERPALRLHAGLTNDALFLDVATTPSADLVMRACEIAAEHRPIHCGQVLSRLGRNDAAVVVEETEGEFFVQRVAGRKRPRRPLFETPVEPGAFVVQALVEWPRIDMPPLIPSGAYQPYMNFELSGVEAYMLSVGVVNLEVRVNGEKTNIRPDLRRSHFRSPVQVQLALPTPRGDISVEARLVSERGDESSASESLVWTYVGTQRAGQLFHCAPAWPGASPAHFESVTRDGQRCLFVPWWSVRYGSRFSYPGAHGHIARDWRYGSFPFALFLLSLLGVWLVARPKRPTHVAERRGQRASYREAPRDTWTVQTVRKLQIGGGFRLVRTPFGLLAIGHAPLWVRQRDELPRYRRRFFLRGETLVVCETAQYFFHRCSSGVDFASSLETVAASELKDALGDEQMAKDAQRRANITRGAHGVLVAAALATLCFQGVFFLASVNPRLTQRDAFVSAVVCALAGSLLLGQWMWRAWRTWSDGAKSGAPSVVGEAKPVP